MASDAPAYYMWSARTLRKTELLRALLDADSENARVNAALTLALLDTGGEKVIRILSASALSRDGYIARAGRKYLAPRAIAAICALGRLADPAALPALYALTEDESFIDMLPFEPYDFMADRADYRFQYRSHIITALCAIAKVHPAYAGEIRDRLRRYDAGKTFDVTMMGPVLRYDDTQTLLGMIESL